MVKTGRSLHTLKFTKKLIKEGFKFYVLAFASYLYPYSRVFQTALFNKKVDSGFEKLKLCYTSKVVLQLVQSLSYTTFEYTIYLDNFFVKADLLHVLRTLGIGACGTVPKGKAIKKIFPEISFIGSLGKWGSILVKTHPEFSDVSCSLWQDNNIVAILTTVHSGDQFILRLYHRPRDTSTSAVIMQASFIRNSTISTDQELQFDPYRRPPFYPYTNQRL